MFTPTDKKRLCAVYYKENDSTVMFCFSATHELKREDKPNGCGLSLQPSVTDWQPLILDHWLRKRSRQNWSKFTNHKPQTIWPNLKNTCFLGCPLVNITDDSLKLMYRSYATVSRVAWPTPWESFIGTGIVEMIVLGKTQCTTKNDDGGLFHRNVTIDHLSIEKINGWI